MGIKYTTLGIDTPDIAPGAVTPAKLSTTFVTIFMVNDDGGSDSNNGLSWAKPLKTIQAGLDAVSALAKRGKGIVLVAPGGYSEDLVTPTNALGPFGQLIAVNSPDNPSGGAVWLTSTDPANPILTVRARGWLIDGFEFDLPAGASGAAAVILDSQTSLASGDYTHIRRCSFQGGLNSRMGIDFKNNLRLVIVEGCEFFDIFNSSGTGEAIGCSYSTTANARLCKIIRNLMRGNDRNISFNGNRGCNESVFEDNILIASNAKTPTGYLTLAGGTTGLNVVRRNLFGGTYSIAGGYSVAQSNDIWAENYDATGALKTAQPG